MQTNNTLSSNLLQILIQFWVKAALTRSFYQNNQHHSRLRRNVTAATPTSGKKMSIWTEFTKKVSSLARKIVTKYCNAISGKLLTSFHKQSWNCTEKMKHFKKYLLFLLSVNEVKINVEEIRDEINRKTSNYPSSYELTSLQENVIHIHLCWFFLILNDRICIRSGCFQLNLTWKK